MSALLAALFGKETLVGLDIGSAYLKAVQVETQKDGFRITRAAQRPTPAGAVRDGVVLDRDAVASELQQLIKAAGITATGAVTAVAGPSVVVRQIKMPKMTEAALRRSVKFEAGKYISSSLDDSSLAFEIMGAVDNEPNQMDVMLVAAPREMVESRIDVVERAGLEAVAMDMEAFALQRSLIDGMQSRYDDNGLRALVDIGASHTEVTILSGARFALTRSVPIAGDHFTETLKNGLRVDALEANRLKTEVDLNLLVQGGDPATTEEAQLMDAVRAVQGTLDELLREVRRSINFYQSQLGEGIEAQVLSEILLSGGTAKMRGMDAYVTARLATTTRVGTPLDAGSPFVALPESCRLACRTSPATWRGFRACRQGIHALAFVPENVERSYLSHA